jgi:hypothetical protein
MIATPLLYLQSKFELAGMNTRGSRRCMFCYSATTMEKNNLEQLYAIKFCVKLGEVAIDTYEKFQEMFGNDSLSCAQIFRWHKDFVNWRQMVED